MEGAGKAEYKDERSEGCCPVSSSLLHVLGLPGSYRCPLASSKGNLSPSYHSESSATS